MCVLPCSRAVASWGCREAEVWKERRLTAGFTQINVLLSLWCINENTPQRPQRINRAVLVAAIYILCLDLTFMQSCCTVYTHNHWNIGRPSVQTLLWLLMMTKISSYCCQRGDKLTGTKCLYLIATLKSACLHPNCVVLSLSPAVSSYSFTTAWGREEWPQC